MFVDLDMTVPRVPGKEGAWLVLPVFSVASLGDSVGLYCCGVCGRSGETGTVVFKLGAVAVKQMCSAEAPQKF